MLTIEPATRWRGDEYGARQLRAVLKRMLRSLGVKCVDLRPAAPPDERQATEDYAYLLTPNATDNA